jgi:hypothetical protein
MAVDAIDIGVSIHGRRLGLTAPRAGLNSLAGLVINHGISQTLLGYSEGKTVTSAQLLALNATPQTIITAPPAGFALIPTRMLIHKPAGVAYAGIAVGEDLVLKYTNGSGAQITGVIETTGFLDQATAQTRVVGMPGSTGSTASDYTPVSAAAAVLHLLTGEIITGDQPLYVRVWYDIVPTVFTFA